MPDTASAQREREGADAVSVTLFQDIELSWRPGAPHRSGDVLVVDDGQTAEISVELPDRGAWRITAIVTVQPITAAGGVPGDPWSRLGSLSVRAFDDSVPQTQSPEWVELMRFVTGFGGAGVFEADVSDLAPVLWGPRRVRLSVDTFLNPGWKVSAALRYTSEPPIGRPALVVPAWGSVELDAQRPLVRAEVDVSRSRCVPRVRIYSTGHGSTSDEFVSRTHVLRVDGREVLRWRPWTEPPRDVRDRNPWAGRRMIGAREVWACDASRSGWAPGYTVAPLVCPLPELTPGRHTVELEILDLVPSADPAAPNFWQESLAILSDAPCPKSAIEAGNANGAGAPSGDRAESAPRR